LSVFKSAFEKLSTDNLIKIEDNTRRSAEAVTSGGSLFKKIESIATSIEKIEKGAGKMDVKTALAVRIVSPAIETIGLGLGFVVEALNSMEDSPEDAEAKFKVLINGLVDLGDVGKALFNLAKYLVLSIPLLILTTAAAPIIIGGLWVLFSGLQKISQAIDNESIEKLGELDGIGSTLLSLVGNMALISILIIPVLATVPIIVGTLWLLLKGLQKVASLIDEETIEKLSKLDDVGKSILIFAGSLALINFIAIPAMLGLLAAGVLILGVGAILKLMEKFDLGIDKLTEFGESLKIFALGLLYLGGTLALVGLAAPLIFTGLMVSVVVIGGIGLVMKILESTGLIESIDSAAEALEKTAKALFMLGGTLVLIGMFAKPAFYGLAVSMGIIIAIGGAFYLLDKMNVERSMTKISIALLDVSIAILALGLTIALLGTMSGYILPGIGVVSLMVLLVGGVFYALDKMNVERSMIKISGALAIAGLGILAISFAFYLADRILPNYENVLILLGLISAVGLVFYIAGLAFTQILKGAFVMGVAGLALILLGYGLKAITSSVPDLMTGLGVIALIIGVGAAFALAGLVAVNIILGSAAMALAGISMLVLSVGVTGMVSAMSGEITLEKIGLMAALIVGVGAAYALAGFAAANIILGSAAMTAAGISLLVLGGGIAIITMATKGLTLEQAGIIGAIILGVGASFAAAGIASPLILLGSAAMLVAAVALVTLTGAIAVLNTIGFAELTSKNGIFGDSGQVTSGFLGIGAGRPKTNLEVMMEAVANSFMLNPISIAAMYAGAPALIMAAVALTSIAFGVKQFQKIAREADLSTLGANVNEIVNSLSTTFANIGQTYPGGRKSLFNRVFGGGGQSVVADGISSVMGMGSALTGIARGVQAMANLKFPTKWDKEGNPIAFEKLDKDAAKRVLENTQMLVRGLAEPFALIGRGLEITLDDGSKVTVGGGGRKGLFQRIFTGGGGSPVADGISAVMGMGEALTGIAQGTQAMADLKFPTGFGADGKPTGYQTIDLTTAIPKLIENTKSIVVGMSSVFGDIGADADKQRSWFFGKSNTEKGIKIVQGFAEPVKSLAETVKIFSEMEVEVFSKVPENFRKIVTGLTNVFGDIGKDPDAERSWWFGKSNIEKGVKIVKKIADPAKDIADVVKALTGEGVGDFKANIKNIIAGLNEFAAINLETLTAFNLASSALGSSSTSTMISNLDKLGNTAPTLKGLGKVIDEISASLLKMSKIPPGNLKHYSEPIAFLAKTAPIVARPITQIADALVRIGNIPNQALILSRAFILSIAENSFDKQATDLTVIANAFEKMAKSTPIIAGPITIIANAIVRIGNTPIDALTASKDFMMALISSSLSLQAESMTIIAAAFESMARSTPIIAGPIAVIANAIVRIGNTPIDALMASKDFMMTLISSPLSLQAESMTIIATAFEKMARSTPIIAEPITVIANAIVRIGNTPINALMASKDFMMSLISSPLSLQAESMTIIAAAFESMATGFFTADKYKGVMALLNTLDKTANGVNLASVGLKSIASSALKISNVNIEGVNTFREMAWHLNRSAFGRQAQSIEKIANSYKVISDASKDMDKESIRVTTEMFEALAYLSSKGKDNAIEQLGEELVNAITRLAQMIADFEGTVNAQNEGSKTVQESVARAVDGLTDAVGLAPKSKSSSTNSGSSSSSSSSDVIQDLIDLFQNGSARVVITDLEQAAAAKI